MGTRWARIGHRMGTKKAKLVRTILALVEKYGARRESHNYLKALINIIMLNLIIIITHKVTHRMKSNQTV